jgi:hypothetical protein
MINRQVRESGLFFYVYKATDHFCFLALSDQFSIVATGYISPDVSGTYEFGLVLVGRACLYVDGKLVIDNGMTTQQTLGQAFYGLGTEEVKGVSIVAITSGLLLTDTCIP